MVVCDPLEEIVIAQNTLAVIPDEPRVCPPLCTVQILIQIGQMRFEAGSFNLKSMLFNVKAQLLAPSDSNLITLVSHKCKDFLARVYFVDHDKWLLLLQDEHLVVLKRDKNMVRRSDRIGHKLTERQALKFFESVGVENEEVVVDVRRDNVAAHHELGEQ